MMLSMFYISLFIWNHYKLQNHTFQKSIVMCVSELFVHRECIIDSLARPGKKLGVLGGADLKNNNDDLKRPKNIEILVAPPSE